MKSASVWRAAFTLLSVRFVLAQLGLVAAVLGLFLVWLRLPDASTLQVVGSVFFALAVAVGAGVAETWLLLNLAGRPLTRGRFILGTLLLCVGFLLWFAWSAWLAHLARHDAMLAGYLNSRLPYQLRNLRTFEHGLLWLAWMWATLRLVGAGLLATLLLASIAGGCTVQAIRTALRSSSYWFMLLVGGTVATLLTGALLTRISIHGLWAEVLSLGVRLAVAALCDVIVVCWFLAMLAVCIRRANVGHAMPAGGPDDSQPRTVAIP